VKRQCSALWNSPGVDGHLTSPFTPEELSLAIKLLKCGQGRIKGEGATGAIPRALRSKEAPRDIFLL